MPDKIITIEFEGMHENEGHLPLAEFIGQLGDILSAFRQKERLVVGSAKNIVDFEIIGLSYSSPYNVNLRAKTEELESELGADLVNGFLRDLDRVVKKQPLPPDLDAQTLEAYKKIGTRIGKTIEGLTISSDDYSCAITSSFSPQIDLAEGPEYKVLGSITGRIEAINAHGDKREFRLFPQVGPERVVCRFPPGLVEKVGNAFYKRATVFGWLKYKRGAKYPHLINVDDIYIHRKPDGLPKLGDLRGIAPDITGGLRAEDFVGANRDVEH
jgi:hypothetical protein